MQARHQHALRQALEWLPTVAQSLGVVASGSIVRGNPHAASDLDIVILHGAAWRRRVQRWFNETPTELFFNSEAWLRSVIEREAAQGRPVMAHMLATGMLLQDTGGRMAAIVDHARAVLERGPCLGADALLRDRYAAATLVEDALDFAAAPMPEVQPMAGGPLTADLRSARDAAAVLNAGATPDARFALLARSAPGAEPDSLLARAAAVEALLRHAYLSANIFLPRPKERLALLPDRGLAGLLAAALSAPPDPASEALRRASEQVLGGAGFFAWDSGPDHSTPQ